MSYDDIFERMRKRALRIMRDIMSDFDEMEAWMRSMVDDLEDEMRPEQLFEERLKELRSGVLSPLISVHDRGDHLVIVVDLSGSDPRTVDVRLTRDRIAVRAQIRSEALRKAYGQVSWAMKVSYYSGEQALPEPVDPRTAKSELKGGVLIITVRKASS
ncbi:Hsp20/alpha crystallin family protein [Acidilobus sp.]|jgi:HSP20 family protein|uniref:Hsp20/alpha crystallin family protein n=1 Tax=Acidilobus sp. TaxID=1872109 RepID=UPI003CFD03D4